MDGGTRCLPVKLKYLIEGEEEIGSAFVEDFLRQRTELACDVVVMSDCASLVRASRPSPTACAGSPFLSCTSRGQARTFHSGTFGGSVMNPANALTKILAAMIDDRGSQLPGFFDDVAPISDLERRQIAALPFDETQYKEQIGVTPWPARSAITLSAAGPAPRSILTASAPAEPNSQAHHTRYCIGQVQFPPGAQPTAGKDRRELANAAGTAAAAGRRIGTAGAQRRPGVVIPIDSPYIEAAAARSSMPSAAGRFTPAKAARSPS